MLPLSFDYFALFQGKQQWKVCLQFLAESFASIHAFEILVSAPFCPLCLKLDGSLTLYHMSVSLHEASPVASAKQWRGCSTHAAMDR
jgi:hypothetical protein